MGGLQQSIPQPNSTVPMQMLGNLGGTDASALKNNAELLLQGARIPLQPYTPDLFGGGGAATQMGMISAIDAFKNKQLEQQANPPAAAARQALFNAAQEDVSPDYWNKQMAQYAKTTGLENKLASGLGDSTIGKSSLFDQATAQGQAFRNANLAQAQQLIGNAPTGGYIDPSSAISAQQAAQAQNAQARGNLIGGVLQGAQANQQSTTDAINQLLNATSGAYNASQQNWQNWYQAQMNQKAQQSAQQNALLGTGISALGTIGGAAVGGPLGAALGGSLASMGSKALMPSGGYSSLQNVQSAAPYAGGYSNVQGIGYVPQAQGIYT